MWFLMHIFISTSISSLYFVSCSDVRVPPTIVRHPIETKIYRLDDEIVLECAATGTPPPQYEWTKNGRPLGYPSNIYRNSTGSIQIKPLSSLDEGHYQCLASNEYGTALSRTAVLRRAMLSAYDPGAPIFESPQIEEGQPYTLRCKPTKCFPRATFTWAVAKSEVDESPITLSVNDRIQIDEEGALHFSYVTMADAQEGRLYKCNMYNPYMDTTIGGSYSRLNVKARPSRPLMAPSYLFSSHSTVVALEGQNISIRCFYSGHPQPTLKWSKAGGLLPQYRNMITNYNTELVIRNVQASDEGDYYCQAVNYQRSPEHRIHIDVQAVPVFKKVTDRLQNINATEGDSLELTCNAYAEPQADVVWMRNGLRIDPDYPPKNYRLSEDRKTLHISEVCKTCKDGSTDLAVIQCNASNEHGYAFSEGYINVLKRTLLTEQLTNIYASHDQQISALFYCNATTDDSTTAHIRWYSVRTEQDPGGAGDQLIHNVTNRISITDNGRMLNVTLEENSSDWSSYSGDYKCVASNGYSTDQSTASLHISGPVTPAPIVGSALTKWWWVFVLAAALLLLFILLICCCLCVRRNKGDSYYVDEKERQSGNNPIQELKENGFHDYKRPDREPLQAGSRASLNSSMKMDSEDGASLNEYGDIDTGKFTEDGSFIGNYRTARWQTNNGSANHHHV